MRIATWNVNGVRAREAAICDWLGRENPDLLLMQEIKCEAAAFPACFAALGYTIELCGQKGFNGVAILSRAPAQVTQRGLPGLPPEDAQARYIEVATAGLHIGNLYLPNGNSGGDVGYQYKLRWLEALGAHARGLLAANTPLILAGDYNVAPEDIDFAPNTLGPADALIRPETRARYRSLLWMGLTDAVRALTPDGPIYTFWDYQAGCWPRDLGLRIDHALLSPTIAERLISATPDKAQRGLDQPSDHVPVVVELR